MVHGLVKFSEYFKAYSNQYVFIGGTACDLLMNELGAPFRATRDLDIVLIIEELDEEFGKTFWQFIEDGGYGHRNMSTGEYQFYRFSNPARSDFPVMVELFSRRPVRFILQYENGRTPIHIYESIKSLSAILLNEAYYDHLMKNRRLVEGLPIIGIETIILFKIRAWIDLDKRKDAGEPIDSRDINKHKNDIFRLLANILPSQRIEIVEGIHSDVLQFNERIQGDKPDLKNLGLRHTSFEELMELLIGLFKVSG